MGARSSVLKFWRRSGLDHHDRSSRRSRRRTQDAHRRGAKHPGGHWAAWS